MIEKYSRYQKFSSSDLVSKFLLDTYNQREGCWIIPFIPLTSEQFKKRSKCWAPLHLLKKILTTRCENQEEHIARFEAFKSFVEDVDFSSFKFTLNPIKQFFNIKTEMFKADQEESF